MISKGKRRYLVWLYWSLTSPYVKPIVGKQRGPHSLTKGYYDGVRKLNYDLDTEVFIGLDILGPNAKHIKISRSEVSGINTEYPKVESVDLTEVLNDFKKARKASA